MGRYFPLTIASHITEAVKPVALIDECHHWLEQAEEIALSTLEDDFQLEDLEQSLAALGEPVVSRINPNEAINEIHKEKRFQGHFLMDPVNSNPLSSFPAISHFLSNKPFPPIVSGGHQVLKK
nr:TagF domain-containing protein [sulfur-oxidizing endosymbiont of Gigantopelta aegis]